MQPEDLSGGVPAGMQRIPDSWVKRRVEATVIRPVNPDQPAYFTSLSALTYEGILAEMLAASTSWGAVLSLRLTEEQ